jgi:hypothetical protein
MRKRRRISNLLPKLLNLPMAMAKRLKRKGDMEKWLYLGIMLCVPLLGAIGGFIFGSCVTIRAINKLQTGVGGGYLSRTQEADEG